MSEEQAKELENCTVENGEEEEIETTCYLVVLRGSELKEVFETEMVDIRLCVYLDPEKRIVRISTLPGESLVTDTGEGEMALNLTGKRRSTGWKGNILILKMGYKFLTAYPGH